VENWDAAVPTAKNGSKVFVWKTREANPLGRDRLRQFVRQEHGRPQVVLARPGRQNDEITVLGDLPGRARRLGRAVDDQVVMPFAGVEGAVDGAEALDRDFGPETSLDAVAVPVKGGALADVEVGDFHVPALGREGTGDKPAEGALAGTALLGDDSDRDGHEGKNPLRPGQPGDLVAG